jgi:hypothetical protein
MREKYPFDLAEAPGERDHLRFRQVLIPEAEHGVLVECRFDLCEVFPGKLREVSAKNLRTNHVGRRDDLHLRELLRAGWQTVIPADT